MWLVEYHVKCLGSDISARQHSEKCEHWAPCHIQISPQYDWKFVEWPIAPINQPNKCNNGSLCFWFFGITETFSCFCEKLEFGSTHVKRTRPVWHFIFITKTYLYNSDPLKPHFYIVKLGFAGVQVIFLISAQNMDCGYSLEPPRRGSSNEYPQSMFWAEIWKISQFFNWKF